MDKRIFNFVYFRPRVPLAMPCVFAHRIRDIRIDSSDGVILSFYEDIPELRVHPEWAAIMQPHEGMMFVTAPRGGTLLLNNAQFNHLFKPTSKGSPNVTK